MFDSAPNFLLNSSMAILKIIVEFTRTLVLLSTRCNDKQHMFRKTNVFKQFQAIFQDLCDVTLLKHSSL